MFKATKKSIWMPSIHAINITGGAGGGGGPTTIFTANPALSETDPGNLSTTFRVICLITGSVPTTLRVSIQPGSSAALTVTNVGVGKWADVYSDTTAVPVEALFAGASGFSNKTTVQQSDTVNVSSLGLVSGDSVVVTYVTGGSGQASLSHNDGGSSPSANADTWWQTGNFWNTQSPGALNELAGWNFAVASIEAQ